jgi:capsid protein
VEITLETFNRENIKTVEDIRGAMGAVVERVKELKARDELSGAELESVKNGLAEVHGAIKDMRTGMLMSGAQLTSDEYQLTLRLPYLARIMKAPPGISRLHFNTVAFTPNELAFAYHLGRERLPGLAPIALSRSHFDRDVDRLAMRVSEFQALQDMLLLCDVMMAGNPDSPYAQISPSRIQRMKTLAMWPDYEALSKEFQEAYKRAGLDTLTSGEGLEWIPTFFSGTLQDRVRIALSVAALIPEFTMPAPTFVSPVLGGDAIAYFIGESTDELSPAGASIDTTTFNTKKTTWTAKKLATRIVGSSEVLEDSIVPMAPLITDQIVLAIANAIEDSHLNGDTTATHQDSDVTSGKDRRKIYKGFRKLAFEQTGTTARVDNSNAAITEPNLFKIRKLMGRYGNASADLVLITGFNGYIQFIAIDKVLTVDKYGSQATILTGELGKFINMPIVVSEFMREDLNASGVYDGVTTNRTSVIVLNRRCYARGVRRTMTLGASRERAIEYDQVWYVGTWRGDLQPWYPSTTERCVGLLYNVTTA